MQYTDYMDLKVVTLNIWDGGKALNAAVAYIRQENPEVIGLQEVYDGKDPQFEQRFRTLEILKAALDYPYNHFAIEFVEKLPFGSVPQGNAVFSRFPIKDQHTTYFFRPPDLNYVETIDEIMDISHNLEHLVLETPAGLINFINFHGPKNNNGDEDSVARQTTVRILLEEIKGKSNVIVTGDTNARPTNASIKKLSTKINNVFGDTLTTTFNMNQKTHPGYATSVVDMIFVSDSFEVINKYQPQVDVSDHLPLVVQLRLAR